MTAGAGGYLGGGLGPGGLARARGRAGRHLAGQRHLYRAGSEETAASAVPPSC